MEVKPGPPEHHEEKPHPVRAEQDPNDPSSKNGDIGAQWLATYAGSRHDISDEESTVVRKRIDRFLMPIIFYIYFTQQLDKSSLSFSSIFGIQKDANLHGTEYSWLSSIVYFAQLVCQPLSVYALVKFPVNRWICFCFCGWGTSLCIMTACRSFASIAAMRFILGGFEASIAPSMLVVVSMWWTRREQPLRNNIWYSAKGLATILGSLLSYGLGHAKSSLYPYQLIFLVCGLIAVVLSFPTMYLFPSHPTRARWLSEEQKYVSLERIRLNNTGTQSTHFKWAQVRECLMDPKSWMWVVMIFCISLVSGGIGAFGPLILQGFGLNQFQTILYNMIPGGIGIAVNILSALAMQYSKLKSPTLLIAAAFPLAAAAALYALPRGIQYKHELLAVFFLLQVYQCITAIVFSWCFANTAGHTKKTTTTGMLYLGLTVGNIVGPQLYKSKQAPYYHSGLTANLIVLCIMVGTIFLQVLYLRYLNLRNVRRRKASGKSGVHIDYSLENSSHWEQLRGKQHAAEIADHGEVGQGAKDETYNAKAFLDLTDLENEDFVYSL
ncbi:major facilitator superfamily domain-containing protein [Naematelia encephala]|uniref:Major facilitator superfamily domain-containing protein n=1 Tax=Naematelia encephala TaxID=71784 RepID=A0A1Y2AYU8_9TREE|nr:major facilitator superfamily domain-containing protein [Naematelia encephala]